MKSFVRLVGVLGTLLMVLLYGAPAQGATQSRFAVKGGEASFESCSGDICTLTFVGAATGTVRENGQRSQVSEIFYDQVVVDFSTFTILSDTFGTGDEARAVKFVYDNFDFRPANIIRELDLLRPIYRQTTNYGHFGKAGLPWEKPVPVAV